MSGQANWIDRMLCYLNAGEPWIVSVRDCAQYHNAVMALRAELAAAIKERDEALDERSYWYREHSRLIEKLVSLEREDNERKRLDAIERIDAMTRWMDQVTAMLCHSMTHSHDAKQGLVTRCDAAIAAMRKGATEGK